MKNKNQVRLSQALRMNLQRRKAQIRARRIEQEADQKPVKAGAPVAKN